MANNDPGQSPFILQVKSRGTLASPTATQAGDKIGGNGYAGWNSGGANWATAEIDGFATENHTPAAQGSELRFYTVANGTSFNAHRASVQENGSFNMLGNTIQGVGNPVNPQDAATKAYVDSIGGSVFGQGFQFATSDGASSTSSTTFQTKIDLTTTTLPAGNYRIGYSYSWRHNDINTDFRYRLLVDNSTTLVEHRVEPKDPFTDQLHPGSGFTYRNLSGSVNIKLQWCSSAGADTATILGAKLEIWRVS
jgi:hypothetical protein